MQTFTDSKKNDQGTRPARFFFWGAWVLICLVYIGCRYNVVAIPLDRDEGLFGYIGQVILDNGVPYRDAIDHKPPGAYYLYALGLLLFPPTPSGVHLFLHAFNFLTLIAVYFLARFLAGAHAPGLWAAFAYAIISSSPLVQGYAASTEMLMLLPLALSLVCAVCAVRKGSLPGAILSGICSAATFWIKHTGAVFVLLTLGYLFFAGRGQGCLHYGKLRRAPALCAAWLTGFAGLSLLVAGYFYSQGAFDAFVYWNFTHNYYYGTGQGLLESLPRIWAVVFQIISANPFIAGTMLLGVLMPAVKRDARGYFSLCFIAASFAATIPGYAYKHYFAQIVPAAALASGCGFAWLAGALRGKQAQRPVLALCALLALAVPLWVQSGYYFTKSPDELSRDFFPVNPFPETVDAGTFIAQHTAPEDLVFIFGSEAQILFYAQRRSASPFALLYPLTRTMYPHYREQQQQVWNDIVRTQPAYIIIVNVPQSVLWDGQADLWLYRQIERLVAARYFLEAGIPVAKPKGRLCVNSDTERLLKELAVYKYTIRIFRLKQYA